MRRSLSPGSCGHRSCCWTAASSRARGPNCVRRCAAPGAPSRRRCWRCAAGLARCSGPSPRGPATWWRSRWSGIWSDAGCALSSNAYRATSELDHNRLQLAEAHVAVAEARRQYEQRSLIDPLTRLPNRAQLERLIERALRADSGPVALLSADLDRFAEFNETLGREAGDELLRRAAERLIRMPSHMARQARRGAERDDGRASGRRRVRPDAAGRGRGKPRRSCSVRAGGAAREPDRERQPRPALGEPRDRVRRRPPGRSRDAASARRDGDVRGEAPWRWSVSLLQRGSERRRASAGQPGRAFARGLRAGRPATPLPALARRSEPARAGRRGAAALERPRARLDPAVGVHPGGRGHGADGARSGSGSWRLPVGNSAPGWTTASRQSGSRSTSPAASSSPATSRARSTACCGRRASSPGFWNWS